MILRKSIKLDGNYSGIRFPQDLILKKSLTYQEFTGSVSFANKLEVSGYVDIDQVNGIRMDTICDMVTMPTDGFGPYGLEIKGKRCYCYRIYFETLICVAFVLMLGYDSCMFNLCTLKTIIFRFCALTRINNHCSLFKVEVSCVFFLLLNLATEAIWKTCFCFQAMPFF